MDRALPLMLLGPLALAACLAAPPPPLPTGAEDFATYCAGCHGTGGRGDGELARTLDRRPADLTRLARGGTFPTTKVMAKIWGYTGGRGGAAVMPAFGPLLDSDLVPYDGGDGIMSPTPIRLVQIAEHLKTLQAR
jgi:mono/diheme cytochrome c family protein